LRNRFQKGKESYSKVWNSAVGAVVADISKVGYKICKTVLPREYQTRGSASVYDRKDRDNDLAHIFIEATAGL
jgi:hypothetical protein